MGGPPTWGMDEVPTTPRRKNLRRYETFHKVLALDRSLGTKQAVEKELEIWRMNIMQVIKARKM
jgi:hypothetical protein